MIRATLPPGDDVDQRSCADRLKADVFNVLVGVLSPLINRDMVTDLIASANRSDSLYDRVVYSKAAASLCEYSLTWQDWHQANVIFHRYLREFNAERHYDILDV